MIRIYILGRDLERISGLCRLLGIRIWEDGLAGRELYEQVEKVCFWLDPDQIGLMYTLAET